MIKIGLALALSCFSAIAPFTERGKADFDVLLKIMEPHGTWVETEKGSGKYKFWPKISSTYVPLTNGRWVYSNYGWYWLGNDAFTAITDHYGFWVLGKDNRWAWHPDPNWHSDIVDWRETETHIGWRPSALTSDGSFVESEEMRLARPDTWIFISKEKFGSPMTSNDVITGAAAERYLKESVPTYHVFVGFRELQRAGPNPAPFRDKLGLKIKKEVTAPPVPELPRAFEDEGTKALRVLQAKRAMQAAQQETNGASTNAPALDEAARKKADDEAMEKLRLQPIVIMSLPTVDTAPPADAKSYEFYIFRPVLYQDREGMNTRVKIRLNPNLQKNAREEVISMVQAQSTGIVVNPAALTNSPAVSTNATTTFAPVPIVTPPRPTDTPTPESTTSEAPSTPSVKSYHGRTKP